MTMKPLVSEVPSSIWVSLGTMAAVQAVATVHEMAEVDASTVAWESLTDR